jgi:lauroyl/myristoyl acyltransferase
VGLLPLLALLAWATPESAWPTLADRLAGLRIGLRGARAADEIARFEAVVGARSPGLSARECWRRQLANKYRAWLLLFRCYWPRGWRPRIRLEGGEELAAALAAGKGAILWVAPFAFSDLITKLALYEAGHLVSHLSRDSHGFSTTRLARRLLNPIQTRIEGRYVAERLVMTEDNTVGPLRDLVARLEANRPVSITLAATGQRSAVVRCLGGQMRIATGAPGLAWQTGAPLLPTFTLGEADGSFVTRIEPALRLPSELARLAAIDAMLADYVAILEAYVLRSPDQFPLPYLMTG